MQVGALLLGSWMVFDFVAGVLAGAKNGRYMPKVGLSTSRPLAQLTESARDDAKRTPTN